MKILACDSYYKNDSCLTIAGAFDSNSSDLFRVHKTITVNNEAYVSGEFYKRELPGIVLLLKEINLQQIDCIVIDGYVLVNGSSKLGLGGHLYFNLEEQIPVIGVAKNHLRGSEKVSVPILRGSSKKPLYVSSLGIECKEAAEIIKNLKGEYRIPDALKKIDMLSKTAWNTT